jgi:hypothetical protein
MDIIKLEDFRMKKGLQVKGAVKKPSEEASLCIYTREGSLYSVAPFAGLRVIHWFDNTRSEWQRTVEWEIATLGFSMGEGEDQTICMPRLLLDALIPKLLNGPEGNVYSVRPQFYPAVTAGLLEMGKPALRADQSLQVSVPAVTFCSYNRAQLLQQEDKTEDGPPAK